jgi:hypothetical protein
MNDCTHDWTDWQSISLNADLFDSETRSCRHCSAVDFRIKAWPFIKPIKLCAEDYEVFMRALTEPPAPNEKLKGLMQP